MKHLIKLTLLPINTLYKIHLSIPSCSFHNDYCFIKIHVASGRSRGRNGINLGAKVAAMAHFY